MTSRATRSPSTLRGWEATERIAESGGFQSRQRALVSTTVVESSATGARLLGIVYWHAVATATRGLVRAAWEDKGGRLRLLNLVTLLRFGPPELRYDGDTVSCRYPIEGGLLALRPGGSATLAQRPYEGDYELSVVIDEYVPRLAARAGAPRWTGAAYARGQSPFHSAVSRRFFELLVKGHGV